MRNILGGKHMIQITIPGEPVAQGVDKKFYKAAKEKMLNWEATEGFNLFAV